MTLEEKLRLAILALKKIADFDHAPDCGCEYTPVYECCCFDKDQTELAEDALKALGER